ncbi:MULTISPECIES: DUF418 domain-containing protein [Rossellomorea]|uniref:DUF418 domain-containing protein n=1 Tax=Rossellomorea TaxID=2837508 RepID=UPI001CCA7A42|nr:MULTISPECIES: DUF418 domain-containing protein [Rossellomorea]MCA0149006.1 DUF418 domain-containing protein [Rossellomorea vietnamensis]MCC5803014.1 DUF418 domain-containing protein [Rossellomorea vietnamensis]UTE79095.1 DUF418 domain-containing protein [Rossellomorea sp. KS-H15a]WGG47162.1 DUF418 domain-containing protein [Rossellomorea sp. DA94]
MNNLSPIEQSERIVTLDVIRGFSLLGIFIINMISFHSPFLYLDPYTWWKTPEDTALFPWIDVLVQASFYPLFAMMFGYGLGIQQQRATMKGTSFYLFGVRRLLILLGIGCIHAFLIWSGDILINYAVFGLILLGFMRLSGKGLMWLGGILFLMPQLFFSILLVLMTFSDPTGVTNYTNIAALQDSVAAYASGSFSSIMEQRFQDWYIVNSPDNLLFLLLSILPMMMIGAGASKLQLLSKVRKHKKVWMITGGCTLLVGIIIKSLPLLIESNFAYSYIQDFLGGPFLSVSYAIILSLLLLNEKMMKWSKPFASVGKMSLSNYLMQSIIGTLIFYSYGFGLYGEVTLTTGTMLAVGIYVIQVILSEIWLSKFQYGPVEKLWRVLSYGRRNVVKKGEV